MTVTGAASVFTRLPSDMSGTSFALASFEVTKTKRPGSEFASVGPSSASVASFLRSSAGTGLSRNLEWVRPSWNRRSRPFSSRWAAAVASVSIGRNPSAGRTLRPSRLT